MPRPATQPRTPVTRASTLFMALLFSLLLLTACGNEIATGTQIPPAATVTPTSATVAPSTPSPTPTPSVDWQRRWLYGIPCSLPCWEGITPGVTTYDEAVKILQGNPNVTKVSSFDSKVPFKDAEMKVITWIWKNDTSGGNILIPIKGNNVVRYISPNYGTTFTLKELITVFGEPQFIVPYTQADPEGQTYSLILIFADKRFIISTAGAKPITLEKILSFRDFYIYGPAIEDLKELRPLKEEWIQPWQGFKDYDYSCVKVAYLINGCGKMPGKVP